MAEYGRDAEYVQADLITGSSTTNSSNPSTDAKSQSYAHAHEIQGGRPIARSNPWDWPHGWQHSASRTRNLHFRERTLRPALPPSAYALLRSEAGPHAGAWLTAMAERELDGAAVALLDSQSGPFAARVRVLTVRPTSPETTLAFCCAGFTSRSP